jgi:hypothetical protein
MLFKSGSDLAAEASAFAADPPHVGVVAITAVSEKAVPDALAIAEAEIVALRARLHDLEREWPAEIARVRDAAKREAAAAHVRQDGERLAALSAALTGAQATFAGALRREGEGFAARLAGAALRQLVEARAEDDAWLLRVIDRRLADIEAGGVVALALPESCRDLAEELAIPVGTALVFDPALAPGSARIELAMGGIPIRIENGLARLLAALDPVQDAHG